MIERAIQELNEKGGSSEESISEFIKKEYDDLPWAHYTMLKHHLVQLCESGEVVLTRDKRYLLASGSSDVKVRRKCRRRSVKRKREWDWEKKQRKRRRNVNRRENMVPKGDDVKLLFSQQKDQVILNEVNGEENCMVERIKEQKLEGDGNKLLVSWWKDQVTSKEVVEEVRMVEGIEQQNVKGDDVESLLCIPENQGTSNELGEGKDCMFQGIEQQKLEAEFSKDREKLCVAEEKGVDCNSVVLPSMAPSLLLTYGKENSEKSTAQQQSSEPISGMTDICYRQNVKLEQVGKHREDDHMVLSSPEMPPGFESVIMEEFSHVQPQTAVSSELSIHREQLNQHDDHIILANAKASESELLVVEESILTDRMRRHMKRWSKRLSGDKASLTSDILPFPELQVKCPPKSEFSGQDSARAFHLTSVESTLTTEVQGKQCSQWQNVRLDSSETLQQPDPETCLVMYPAEPKHHVTQIRRVLRPRPLKPELQLFNAITNANFSSPIDQQERQKPDFQCADAVVANKLTISILQNKPDLFPEEAECEPSISATREELLPKHHDKMKQQIGLRRRGRPPKSRNPAKAEPDVSVVADITPPNDENQQHSEHRTQATTEKLDITAENNSVSKSVHDPYLEQQPEKPRHRGRGRPPKNKQGACSIKISN